jgi:hypothetical protein
MSKLIQTGRNPDWPKETDRFWRYGSGSPPAWLTDEAKVSGFDPSGSAILETSTTESGGLIIKSATANLVVLPTLDSWILFKEGLGFLSMTNEQKELIYEEK